MRRCIEHLFRAHLVGDDFENLRHADHVTAAARFAVVLRGGHPLLRDRVETGELIHELVDGSSLLFEQGDGKTAFPEFRVERGVDPVLPFFFVPLPEQVHVLRDLIQPGIGGRSGSAHYFHQRHGGFMIESARFQLGDALRDCRISGGGSGVFTSGGGLSVSS